MFFLGVFSTGMGSTWSVDDNIVLTTLLPPQGDDRDEINDDNTLRCRLVDDRGKLPMNSNFRNILMSLLTLVRFSTGDGFIEIMHRSALVSHDFPRTQGAVERAAFALRRHKNMSATARERDAALREARLHLPGCVKGSEMKELQRLGGLSCLSYSFGESIEVPCQGTCGTNVAKFVVPIFSLIATFLLLNLSAAIMLDSLRNAQRFSGNRALLTKTLSKKRFRSTWQLWAAHAQARGKLVDDRPEIGKVVVTVQRAVELPHVWVTRHVRAYCSVVLHSTYRMTTLHEPSAHPEWNETFSMPLRAIPTSIVLRVFDRDFSSDSELFLGETRILLDEHALKQPRKRATIGGVCIIESWYPLR